MAPEGPRDAFSADPTLSALAKALTAAMVVDASGAIVWANAAAKPLSARSGLDDSARRIVGRIASSGSEGLARLRIWSEAGAESVTFRSSRIQLAEGLRGMLLQALAPISVIDQAGSNDPSPATDVAAGDDDGVADDPATPQRHVGDGIPLDPRDDAPPPPASAGPETEAEVVAADAPPPPEAEPAPEPAIAEPSPTAVEAAPRQEASSGRFVFETDAEAKLAFLSADFRALTGAEPATVLGRAWSDLDALLGLDPAGAVGRALNGRGGWSGLTVLWPAGADKRLPLSLSALPMFDRSRRFVGFRGLAQQIGDAIGRAEDKPATAAETPDAVEAPGEPEPVETPPAAEIAAQDATRAVEPAPEPDHAASLTQAGDLEGAAVGLGETPAIEAEPAPAPQPPRRALPQADTYAFDAPAPIEPTVLDEDAPVGPTLPAPASNDRTVPPPPRAAFSPPAIEPPAIVVTAHPVEPLHGNVVPLREGQPPAARAVSLHGLSSIEESAFDEIARRLRGLGGRAGDSATPPRSELPDTAEIRPTQRPPLDWTIDDVEGRAPTGSQAEDALRLLDRLPIGAIVLRAGHIAYANRAALDMTGHADLASFIERGSSDLFAEALPRDDAAPSTMRLLASDGFEVEVEARLSTIAWRGAPATLVALKRAEGMVAAAQDAIQREREVSEILDTATDGVLTLDSAGRILSMNRSAEALFGIDERDAVGSLFTLALAPESRRTAYDYLDSLRTSGVAAALNDGREVLALVRQGGAIPIYMTMGRIGSPQEGRFCAVLRDVTHWKKAEEEILAAKRQAERANAQKSEFLARVSHEIRTPLNAIIGFAEVMMEERLGPIGNQRYKDYLRDIRLSGGHLVNLVNDLLDLSRVESGRLTLEFASVDLNDLVTQTATLMQPQANRDRVIIRTSLARRLPQVLADRRSVRQILSNLIANALKLSRPGGQIIVATALTDAGQAVIRVRDAGSGMSKKDLARSLEPFRQLAPSEGETGAGIGLPLTKALAEANEASFTMRSEIGEGTLVEVTFPAARVLAG